MTRLQIEVRHTYHFTVRRTVSVSCLTEPDGATRYRVQAADNLRKPFLTRYFDFESQALSFASKIIGRDD